MKRLLFAVLLIGAVPGAGAAERLDAILRDFAEHGTPPKQAVQRLQAASDVPAADAPVEARRRYHAALARYALAAGRAELSASALAALKSMATKEACTLCDAQLRLFEASEAARQQKLDRARALLAQFEEQPPADPEIRLQLLFVRAVVMELSGDFDAAVQAAVEAGELAGRLGRPSDQARALNEQTLASLGRRDLDRALDLAKEGFKLAKRIGDLEQMIHLRNNQGYVYALQERPELQHEALLDTMRMLRDAEGMEGAALANLINLATYHLQRGEYRESLTYAQRGESLATEIDHTAGRAVAKGMRAVATAHLGRPQAAVPLVQEAIDIAAGIGAKNYLMQLQESATVIYELNGRFDDALAAARRSLALRREVVREEHDAVVLDLQERHSAERRTREIERLSAENARKQAEVEARIWRQRLWAAVTVALLLFGALMVQWLRSIRRRNRRLETDNAVLSDESNVDPLTGAFNRRHCERLMGQQDTALNGRSRDRDYKACVGMLLLDVDFFKKVNDTYGHSAGDAVLVTVARRLRDLVRERDAVVRWGGEEFLLLLPGTPAEALPVVAARVLSSIGCGPVAVEQAAIPVTVSAGGIAWPAYPGQPWEDALHMADQALYLSKSSGRNRATCIERVADGADLERIRHDVAAAGAAGDVDLATVSGPPGGEPRTTDAGESRPGKSP